MQKTNNIKDWVTSNILSIGNIFNTYFAQLYEPEFRFILKCYQTTKGMAKLSPAHCFLNRIWNV